MRLQRILASAATLCAITWSASLAEPDGRFSELTISTELARPTDILTTNDGTLWFIDLAAEKIGRLTTNGNITEFTVPTKPANVRGMTIGIDGNIWFTEWIGGKIGRVTRDGAIAEYSLGPCKYPYDIAVASDNTFWFTVSSSKKVIAPFPAGCPNYSAIGRIRTDGSIAEFPVPSVVGAIAANRDGSLWFTQSGSIGKITANGVIRTFPIPQIEQANYLIVAPDGTLWFSDFYTQTIGHIETSGGVRLTAVFDVKSRSAGLAIDREGRVWFADADTNSLGWITPDGKVYKKELPTRNALPAGITIGRDGAVWFTEYNLGRIGRFALPAAYWTESPGSYNYYEKRGNIEAMNAKFDEAIADWERAASLTSDPRSGCSGEFQRVQIRAAKNTKTEMASRLLTKAQAATWFERQQSALWIPDKCNGP